MLRRMILKMIELISYAIAVFIILIGLARIFRDRKQTNKWKMIGRHLVEIFVILLVYVGVGMATTSIYVNQTENVYPVYERVELEKISGTNLSVTNDEGQEEKPDVYIQDARDTGEDYYLIKRDGERYKIVAYDTEVNYREGEHFMVAKTLMVRDSPFARFLHVNGMVQSVSYYVYLPMDTVDLVSKPEEESYLEYPVPEPPIAPGNRINDDDILSER